TKATGTEEASPFSPARKAETVPGHGGFESIYFPHPIVIRKMIRVGSIPIFLQFLFTVGRRLAYVFICGIQQAGKIIGIEIIRKTGGTLNAIPPVVID